MFVLLFALVFFFVSERMRFFPAIEDAKHKTILVWSFATPANTLMQLKGTFEDQHNVTVDVQSVPWDDLQEKTLWAIAANSNVPDVIVGSSEWTGGLVSSGALEPLDDYLKHDKDFLARFFPSTLGIYQFPEVRREMPGLRGKMRQYGIPLDLDLMMIYYRADIIDPVLAELGMKEFPKTWDDFLKLGVAVRNRNTGLRQEQYLLYLDPDDPVPLSMAVLPSSGGTFLDRKFQRAVFNSKEGVAAFRFMHDLVQSNSAIIWTRATMEDPIVLYKQGRALANISGPWYSKFLEQKAPELSGKWRVALFPTREPGLPTCGLGGACLAIPYNAPHKREAVELIKFMSEDSFALAYFDRVGSPPPQRTAWNSPVFDAEHPYFGGQKIYSVVREAIETARPLQLMPNTEVMKSAVRHALRKITTTEADASKALNTAAAHADRILKEQM